MGLDFLFDQRRIGPTHGSIASLIPLTKPSGPQSTESELETELVEQLDFSARVHDLITQPGIRYQRGGKELRYTADVFAELWPDQGGSWSYYLIEVKPIRRLARWRRDASEKIRVGQTWCAKNQAHFRILTEREIRTPFLANARQLRQSIGLLPDADLLLEFRSRLAGQTARAGELLANIVNDGVGEAAARTAFDRAVANRMLRCDLSKPYDDDALLADTDPLGRAELDADPIIAMLMRADSA